MVHLPAFALAVIIVGSGCSRNGANPKEAASEPDRPAPTADLNAIEILSKSAEAYAKLSSYKDEILIFTTGRNMMPRQASARTSFERGGRLFFKVSFNDPYGPGVTSSAVAFKDGKAYSIKSDANSEEQERDLGEALSKIEMSSARSSIIIPSLLQPEAFAGKTFFDSLVAPRLDKDLKLGDTSYHRISDQRGYRVIIDKSSYLVRRVLLPGGGMVDYAAAPNASLGELDWR